MSLLSTHPPAARRGQLASGSLSCSHHCEGDFSIKKQCGKCGWLVVFFHSLNSSKGWPYQSWGECPGLRSSEGFLDPREQGPPPSSSTTDQEGSVESRGHGEACVDSDPAPHPRISLTPCFPLSPGRHHLADLPLEPPLLHDLLHRDHGRRSRDTECPPPSSILQASSCPCLSGSSSGRRGPGTHLTGLCRLWGPAAAHAPLIPLSFCSSSPCLARW